MSASTSVPDGVSLLQHEKFGETAVANRAFKAGDVVVSERPLLLAKKREPLFQMLAFCAAPQSTQDVVLNSLHIPRVGGLAPPAGNRRVCLGYACRWRMHPPFARAL